MAAAAAADVPPGWTQSFASVLLAEGDLTLDRWLGRPGWFLARPT